MPGTGFASDLPYPCAKHPRPLAKGVTMRTLKLAGLALTLSLILAPQEHDGTNHPGPSEPGLGFGPHADHSTMNVWDKHVVIVVRSVDNDKPGPVVATSKLHQGHFMADMGCAPGKYVVDVKPSLTAATGPANLNRLSGTGRERPSELHAGAWPIRHSGQKLKRHSLASAGG